MGGLQRCEEQLVVTVPRRHGGHTPALQIDRAVQQNGSPNLLFGMNPFAPWPAGQRAAVAPKWRRRPARFWRRIGHRLDHRGGTAGSAAARESPAKSCAEQQIPGWNGPSRRPEIRPPPENQYRGRKVSHLRHFLQDPAEYLIYPPLCKPVPEIIIHRGKMLLFLFCLLSYPSLSRPSTCDRGTEFANWRNMEECLHCDAYFADPYCAWRKNFSPLAIPPMFKQGLVLINARPRKVLKFHSAQE